MLVLLKAAARDRLSMSVCMIAPCMQDEGLQDAMADLRGKFKALITMMGLQSHHFLGNVAQPSVEPEGLTKSDMQF